MRFIMLLLPIFMALCLPIDGKTKKRESFKELDCSGLGDAQEIVECALEAYQSSRIGKLEFSSLLTEAKKNLPHSHTFYGTGIVTGDTTYFAAGKMSDFSFDALFKIPLRMPVYGEWAPEVVLPGKSEKPLAIYPTTTFQAPKLNRDYYWNWHNSGGNHYKAAVAIGTDDVVNPETMYQNCDAVEADKDIEWARKQIGSAVILGENRWCVRKMAMSFDIYVGSFEKRIMHFGGESKEMRVFKDGYYKSGSGVTKFGKPTFESVFQ
uniref:Putative capsid protein n=1 Tax=Soybean thrips virus 3 TaxID=2796557 RepID=A0A7T3R0N0_9VIRU|nr:putative capsid protein [Soybean thrips virus 3]